ncbi:hypothetical protein COZ14_03735 [Candidatus Dojkabacteria bacterium CG_4_10_14_3_um_filter_Dojkabacteria_WS6_41_9]|nr:MAG: hypothetical protein COZ14_03735 [Candidatus Dojkabacteria bacterium CG_4_10_14_3_um_filter_Dojkabacteria_WS6_41_9]
MDKKSIIVLGAIALVVLTLVYFVGRSANIDTKPNITPTPTAIVTQSPSITPIETVTVIPTTTVSPTPTTTVTPTPIKITFLKVTSEKPAPGAGTGTYTFSFSKCTSSSCAHYLLATAKNASFPILSTVSPEMTLPFLITSQTSNLDATAGNSYNEMTSGTEVYLGTTFDGISSDFGDGKSYYVFSVCSAALSTCRKYLLDTTKASATLKGLLIDSRKGKTAYIDSKTAGGDSAAGTTYYYMTTGITVYFK